MDAGQKAFARAEMIAAVAAEPDPGAWLRTLVERMGLRPERCIPLGGETLDNVCAAVVDEAGKQSLSLPAVIAAISGIDVRGVKKINRQ